MQCTWHKVTVQITEQLLRQKYSEHCQTFKTQGFAIIIIIIIIIIMAPGTRALR